LTSLSEILQPFLGTRLVEWFSDLIELWHDTAPIPPSEYQSPKGMTQWIHYQNFIVWHLEEILRDSSISTEKITRIEKAVDKHTHQRIDVLEQIDIWIKNVIDNADVKIKKEAVVHSETPSNIINRLSVLSLKIFHMQERLESDETAMDERMAVELRLNILKEQMQDVAVALDMLLEDLRKGKKQHKVYRQFKIYNDPSFHPETYLNNE